MKLIERGDVGARKLQRFICMRCSEVTSRLWRESDGHPTCDHCEFPLEQQFAMPRLQFFHEGFYEHVSEDGKYITSMDQLAREARDNGNSSQYERDTGIHYDKPKREL